MPHFPEPSTRRLGGRLGVLALMAVLASGCALFAQNGDGEREPGVRIVVENRNWHDATIWVRGASQRDRLGRVTSLTTGRFEIPAATFNPADFRLVAELVGADERASTGALSVGLGDVVHWTIENQLSMSAVTIW